MKLKKNNGMVNLMRAIKAQHVQTPLMMFVDADVIFNHAIEAILNSFAQQGNQGLLSIQPYHETFKF